MLVRIQLYDELTHALTGVPFSPHSDRRFHLFGGRLRTGEGRRVRRCLGDCARVLVIGSLINTAIGRYPFFYDWVGLYESGVIDRAEWKANRFRFL